jgi:hypothetical protein
VIAPDLLVRLLLGAREARRERRRLRRAHLPLRRELLRHLVQAALCLLQAAVQRRHVPAEAALQARELAVQHGVHMLLCLAQPRDHALVGADAVAELRHGALELDARLHNTRAQVVQDIGANGERSSASLADALLQAAALDAHNSGCNSRYKRSFIMLRCYKAAKKYCGEEAQRSACTRHDVQSAPAPPHAAVTQAHPAPAAVLPVAFAGCGGSPGRGGGCASRAQRSLQPSLPAAPEASAAAPGSVGGPATCSPTQNALCMSACMHLFRCAAMTSGTHAPVQSL